MKRGPWVKRCPHGHTSLRHNSTCTYYFCRACGAYYDGEPADARRVDGFPLDDADEHRIDDRNPDTPEFHQ